MGWTCLVYEAATGGATTDADTSAVTDQEFSPRNSHFVFTEPYQLRAQVGMGANLTRMNVSVPKWNALTKMNVWPLMASSTNITSPPRVNWFDPPFPDIPLYEEYQVKNTDSASENVAYAMFPFTPGHTSNLPKGLATIKARANQNVTLAANAWSAPATLSMEQSLRGGVWSIVGAELQIAAGAFFRLIFPSSRFYNGRRLRPGWLCQQAIGDLPDIKLQNDPFILGEWGRFHTFELPTLEVYSIAGSGSTASELRLDLVWISEGNDQPLRDWAKQGWT